MNRAGLAPIRLLPAALLALALPAPAATPVLRIDPARLSLAAEVSERFLSVAVDIDQVVGGTFWDPAGGPTQVQVEPYDFDRLRLGNLARPLAPAWLRLGGSASDRTWYDLADPPLGTPPTGFTLRLTRAQWDAANAFAADLGYTVIFTVNAGPGPRTSSGEWTDTNAGALLAYTAARGYPLGVIEFGNEPNLFAVRAGLSNYDAAAYARDLARFVGLRDALMPGVRVGGPGNIFTRTLRDDLLPGVAFGPRTHEIMPVAGALLDVVEYHYYAAVSTRCPPSGPRVTPETALEAAYLDGVSEPIGVVTALRDQYAPGKPLWLTESGGQSCGGEPGVGDRFLNAFWFLNTLGMVARTGHEVFVRQTLSGSTYGLLSEPALDPQPDYWAALLWRTLMGPRALAVPPPRAAALRVHAHCTRNGAAGDVTLLVLNTDARRPLRVRVRHRRKKPPLRVYVITAPEPASTVVQLNGVALAPAADGTPPPLEARRRRGGLRLPPLAYAFVVVPGAAPALCPPA